MARATVIKINKGTITTILQEPREIKTKMKNRTQPNMTEMSSL
jgi:hypothetical protein